MSTLTARSTSEISHAATVPSPHVMLRVGGLPIERAIELRTTRASQWAAEVIALESELRRRGRGVVDALFAAIKQASADAKADSILLSLKRDVFNQRLPRSLDRVRQRIAQLPPEIAWPVGDWLTLCERHATLLAAGEETLARELAEKRALLKQTLGDARFRQGLFVASPGMEQGIDAYLASPDTATHRRLRATERSALLYLYRTACKTSPFSTLTPVAWGRFDDAIERSERPCPDVSYDADGASLHSDCQLNVAVLSRIANYVFAAPEIRAALPVRLNEDWVIDGQRVRYLRRITTMFDANGERTFDVVKDVPFYLPASPTVLQIIDTLEGGRTMTVAELLERLEASRTAAISDREIAEFVNLLINLELVGNPSLRLLQNASDPVADFVERLKAVRHPLVERVRANLTRAGRLVGAFAGAPAAERRAVANAVRVELTAAFEALGRSESDLPLPLIYEDSALELRGVRLPAAAWQARLDDLGDLQRLLPIVDIAVGQKLAMNAFFKAIYGPGGQCDDVVSFAEIFGHDYLDQYRRAAMRQRPGSPILNPFNLEDVKALDAARQALDEHLAGARAAAGPGYEVALQREAIQRIGRMIPAHIGPHSSHAFLVQLARHDDHDRSLVINRVYNGMGQMFSRFLWLFARTANGDLRPSCRNHLRELQPPGVVFAELLGGPDTNLNLHPWMAPYEIVCHSERSVRPRHEQIRLSELAVRHDPATDSLRLWSRRLESQVVPLHLGLLMPMALPQLHQVLLNFSYAGLAMAPSLQQDGARDGSASTFLPRVRYGHVVVNRAAWIASPDQVPRRDASESDAAHFLALRKWQESLGVPPRVFLSSERGGAFAQPRPAEPAKSESDAGKAKDTVPGIESMLLKPLYVDFESYFSTLVFERAVSKMRRGLRLTEMLPDESQLWFRNGDGRFVSEFVIELNRRERGLP